jgi:hypothetical protein
MIFANDTFQGDLIDPATGQRLVVRIPAWFGAASVVTVEPVATPAPLDDPPIAQTGVWTDTGYLPPGSF